MRWWGGRRREVGRENAPKRDKGVAWHGIGGGFEFRVYF